MFKTVEWPLTAIEIILEEVNEQFFSLLQFHNAVKEKL